jgi:muramoyltetrapeptide carboxypeptidase
MQLPPPLRPGDEVRVVAPSGVFDQDKLEAGIACLVEAGFVPRYEPEVLSRSRYLAGDDERRASELRRALADSRSRAVWAVRGGFGATRIISTLELAAFREAPKWFVGFSDATAVHAACARAGIASLHGPNVTTLPTWTADARRETFELLGGSPVVRYAGTSLVTGARAMGPLLGGNLTVLAAMTGTSAMPSFDGAIVLLEDVGERPYRLDRCLTQLLHAGTLARARGVVVGQLTGCEEPGGGWTPLEVVGDRLATLGVPVLAGLPFGHEPSARSVLLGGEASVDTAAGTLEVRAR